jgi:CHAT domain-containing protein
MLEWGRHKGHRARTDLALKRYDEAARLYREAIDIAAKNDDPAWANRWRAELASLYIEMGDYPLATAFNQQALTQINMDEDFEPAAIARLNEVRLTRLLGNLPEALKRLDAFQPEVDKRDNKKINWQTHIERAETLAGMHREAPAQREFQAALKTADDARKSIKLDEFRLTYFPQLLSIYQNYVAFLAEHNQTDEALQIAELGHARLLAEKLHKAQTNAARFDAIRIARAKNAVILSYSIAPERSYGWVTTANGSRMFPLPPAADLERPIRRHNAQILDQRSINDDRGGRELYNTLISPAADLIPPNGHVIVIPDGPLADLNFETLIPPVAKGAEPHYWLESAVVTIAPSLTLLLPEVPRASPRASLLLVGGTVQADPNLQPIGLGELQQIDRLYGGKCHWLFKAEATPSAVLANNPAQYSLIHFSTHAMPNPQSPLDSYLVLSPQANGEYKLYAHDLATLKLTANLVTLSACQSAGSKNVPGEGLVGLTWAVMSAGARNVVASLWSVGVTSTAGLMGRFYSHLHAGETPAQALHDAKLDMIKVKATPYGWAAFQIYSL